MSTDFSRSLALLRKERGISQRTAAKELGISQALLSHYENGVREPGLAFVSRACDYYNVSADFLLGRTLSRDGMVFDVDVMPDASQEKDNVLRGSVMAALSKKLLVNSVAMLFDLLGKVGSRSVIRAASAYLSTAVYNVFRLLHQAPGTNNPDFFSVSQSHFETGLTAADMICSQVELADARKAKAKSEK